VADPKTEAAFYVALMGWKPRTVDDTKVVLDMGDWGTAIFNKAAADRFAAPARAAAPAEGGGRGARGGRAPRAPSRVAVTGFAWVIDKWNAKTVEGELKKRGLSPVAENGPNGFESFHVKDPDGFDLQIANANGFVKARKTPAHAELGQAPPFDSTGWKTVWLDHLSFGVTNYKESTSFYSNLLGWKPTYDEGSQVEVMIGNVGDTIIRGGNPNNPSYSVTTRTPVHIDHISFGITPWDTDAVKAELLKRGLTATIDVSSAHPDPSGKTDPNTGRPVMVSDDIHTAAFRSYHTGTPNGYNLQISWMNLERRQNLANAVKPKDLGSR
jgi:catechol 2,3-dioxygenase-like lactoylglutathione lyase family enzyme